jgi:endonuclease/exonuclease/phosphatase (EEP) superfamily protein YafD
MALSVALWLGVLLLVVASALPLLKIPHGSLRGLAFPREQFCAVSIGLSILFLVSSAPLAPYGAGMAALVGVFQLAYIVPFTPLWPRQSRDADADLRAQSDRQIAILAANVKLSNRAYDRLIRLVRDTGPDVVMAIEVDNDWIGALKDALGQDLPYSVEEPRDTGYGLCVLSRLPLTDVRVRDLVTDGVPSICATVTLDCGDAVRLYVVHPEPPVIDHDTIGRDSEIALVGMEAAEDTLPAIVSGDLNDVAWSTTTRRFQRLSGLLDPRIGRGFYNTFSATHPWMRWPLDHLFHDPRFRLITMARLGKIGSDHFPMLFRLALARTEAAGTTPDPAGSEEVRDVRREVRAEQARERGPIGTDWED